MAKKLLEQFGVYSYFGYEIQNFKELGLEADKIYNAKKDSEYVREIAKQLGANDFCVYDKIVGEFASGSVACGDVVSHFYNDGILLVELSIDDDREVASLFSASAINQSGDYMGVGFDLVLTNPILDSIHLVEKKRTRIDFPSWLNSCD